MSVAEHDIEVLIDEIFMSTLGMPTRPSAAAAAPADNALDGIIHITGDWQGTVVLQVSRVLAGRIASVMFQLGDAEPSLADMQDALGEITNMTGGNIKALFPGHCHLSLPAVVEGRAYSVRVPSAQVVTRIGFECEGLPASVRLLAAAAGRSV